MLDLLPYLRDFLRASGTGLYALVAQRVYIDPPGLPRAVAVSRCLSFSVPASGGPLDWPSPVETLHVTVKGWGGKPEHAMAVALAAHDALAAMDRNAVTISGVPALLLAATRETAIQVYHDPDASGWWEAMASYHVQVKHTAYTGI